MAVPADKAAVAVTLGESRPAASSTRTIRGKVIDPASKEPIVAARMERLNRSRHPICRGPTGERWRAPRPIEPDGRLESHAVRR